MIGQWLGKYLGKWLGSVNRQAIDDGIRFITYRTTARYGMAEQFDIEILQGDSFDWEITIQDATGVPLNLTTYDIRGMGRKAYTDVLPSFTFVCTKDANQTLNTGKVIVTLDATTTAAISKGSYKYDIEVYTAGGSVKKIYKGVAIVLAEATK